MRDKKRNKMFFLIILLLGISIGYAALTSTLKINGSATITKNTWSVYWDNIGNIKKGSNVIETSRASINQMNNTLINFDVTLNEPGDYYEFQVDAVNAGTLDAMVNIVTVIVNDDDNATLPSYLNLSIKYADDTDIEKYHLLPKADNSTNPIVPTTERFKVKIELASDISAEDLEDISDMEMYNITLQIPYVQADDNAIDRHRSDFELGDYITLVPDASNYSVVKADTGYGSQSITPNELTLWRVIDVHQDGSVDAVSEYVSSTDVYFEGAIGYTQLVGTLQNMASSYAKDGYTIATRMMGYDGQTLVIQDTSAYDGTTTTRPTGDRGSVEPTTGVGEEFDNAGGVLGDTLYLKDYQLVKNVYNTVVANKVGTTTPTPYWLASRSYSSSDATHFVFSGRYVDANGDIYNKNNIRNFLDTRFYNYMYASALRPIITLSSNVTVASGSGDINNPYILN